MTFKTIRDIDLSGKRVLLRADLNVPRHDGKITDTTRIDRLKSTVDYLRAHGAKVIILSHFGRPDGEHNPQMSLAFLVNVLHQRWNIPVGFSQDCIGEKAHAAIAHMNDGDVVLLENIRFHKGEEKNDPAFCKALSELGDVFVNDAFSAAHRAHASTYGLAAHMPTVAGFLMEAELKALEAALGQPKRPVMAIAGGSKISTKLSVLYNLLDKVDYLVLGGGMANTFLYARGADIGNSLCEKDMAEEARKIMSAADSHQCKIILPVDAVTVTTLAPNAAHEISDTQSIAADRMAIDAGPRTIAQIKDIMKTCKTVVWNGPMGVFEIKPFDNGTNELAQEAARLTKSGDLLTIAGGGDTVSALENAGVADDFTYISTAGGAFLEWLEGQTLPGVSILYE